MANGTSTSTGVRSAHVARQEPLLQLGERVVGRGVLVGGAGQLVDVEQPAGAEALLQPGVERGAPAGVRDRGATASAGAACGPAPAGRAAARPAGTPTGGRAARPRPARRRATAASRSASSSSASSRHRAASDTPSGSSSSSTDGRSPGSGGGEDAISCRTSPAASAITGRRQPSGSAGPLGARHHLGRRVGRVAAGSGVHTSTTPGRRPGTASWISRRNTDGPRGRLTPSPHQYPEQSSSRRGRVTATYASRRSSRSSCARQSAGELAQRRGHVALVAGVVECELGQPARVAAQRERQHAEARRGSGRSRAPGPATRPRVSPATATTSHSRPLAACAVRICTAPSTTSTSPGSGRAPRPRPRPGRPGTRPASPPSVSPANRAATSPSASRWPRASPASPARPGRARTATSTSRPMVRSMSATRSGSGWSSR